MSSLTQSPFSSPSSKESSGDSSPLPVRHELPFATVEFFEDYMVFAAHAGRELDFQEYDALIPLINQHFGTRPYGFISMRERAYSLNPMAAKQICEQTNAIAGAVVTQSDMTRTVLEVEKLFYGKPGQAFDTLEQAKAYVLPFIEKAKRS